MLATLNLLAFGLHTVADSLEVLWQETRAALEAHEEFFRTLRILLPSLPCPRWRALLNAMLGREPSAVCTVAA